MKCHFAHGTHRMGVRTRRLISSNFMKVFGLLPCPKKKSFPGSDESHFKEPPRHLEKQPNGESSGTTTSSKWLSGLKGQKISSSDMSSVQEKLRNAVKQIEFLESEENAEYLWAYFGKFLDRVFLYVHTVLTVFVILFSLFYQA